MRFVVACMARTGSTWFIDMLDSHPDITAYSELFNPQGSGHPKWGGAKDLPFWSTYCAEHADSDQLLDHYLDDVFSRPTSGLKLPYQDACAPTGPAARVAERPVGVLHLMRRDLLAQRVSEELAAARGVYHDRSGAPLPDQRVVIDPGELIGWLDRAVAMRRWYADFWSGGGRPYREVWYEDLVESPAVFTAVQEWLGVEPVHLESSLRRLGPGPAPLANRDQVADALAGTRYADLLEMRSSG